MAKEPNARKTCFVIGPISEEGTETRQGADWLLDGIVRPVLGYEPFDYDVKRADEMPEPGQITSQVILATINADLVVADLSHHNANAFYELALRHQEERPVVHMIQKGQRPPFDIKDYRTIPFSWDGPSEIEKAKRQLREQVQAIETEGFIVENPVTAARGRQELARSSDPRDHVIADLTTELDRVNVKIDGLADRVRVAELGQGNDRPVKRFILKDKDIGPPLKRMAPDFRVHDVIEDYGPPIASSSAEANEAHPPESEDS